MQKQKPLRVVLAAVHLEEGPEAIPLGAACIVSALKAAFSDLVSAKTADSDSAAANSGISFALAETFVAEGAAVLIEKIFAPIPAGASGKLRSGESPLDVPLPSAVGFSLYSWNRRICLEAAAQIRRDWSDVFLFCGGSEATALPGGLHRSEGGPFDAVIRGEGERAAAELIGRRFFAGYDAPAELAAKAEPPTVLSEEELALLPSPWLDGTLAVRDKPGVLWELARGCPYSCAYCYESRGDKQVRYIPEERLQKELELFVQASAACRENCAGTGTEGVYVFVLDPTFNTNHERTIRILDMILKETGKSAYAGDIHWHFEVRGELLNREQARRFARLGASLQIGLQTADPKVSALINRSLERGKFASKINLLNEEGVSFGLDLIYGLPGDTLAGYRKSLDFALSLYPNSLDLFRLSVLPGTALADKAAEYGLETEGEAPYMVRSTPDFSAADLAKAEALSEGAEIFYNRGRAVAWFNQVLYPLGTRRTGNGLRPSIFLDEFAAWLKERGMSAVSNAVIDNSVEIEKLQLAFLEKLYNGVKKVKLLGAVRDIVRYHGAWGRALAEGLSTDINFNYDPEAVLGEDALDIESFAAAVKPRPVRARMIPGPEGPELLAE
ncbi:B12-binding domain-containing radical SAM protein [Spirochaetia bacterium]|nr:B12-binding domain-containing radical SAM protein [Spirochaetia bacterium]